MRLRTLLHLVVAFAAWIALPCAAQVCIVTTVAPVFAPYSGSTASGTGSVKVVCTSSLIARDVSYSVNLDMGVNASGAQRRMAQGTSRLRYNLRCAVAPGASWVDGAGGTCHQTGGQHGLIGSLTTTYTVYADIDAGQYVAPGSYQDTVQITVLY